MNKTEIIGKFFIDSYGHKHKVKKVLGEGGQGFVCITETPGIVLKFSCTENEELIDEKSFPNLYKRKILEFRTVQNLPITKEDHLAVPVAIVNDYAGYVMRFMEDMEPISTLTENMENYIKTGGLRRRFELLSKLAGVLSKLHSKGMVYCDLSDNNVFITKNVDTPNKNVWLIDTDNLFIARKNAQQRLVYTPRYAAPELVKNNSEKPFCTYNSDLYSFAILAFECLSLRHPFSGKKILETESAEDDWDAEPNSKRESIDSSVNNECLPEYSGKYSWIFDPLDDSNSFENCFPPELFLTNELFSLFQRMFHEGRTEPTKRPTSFFWQQAFANAVDKTIYCPKCEMSHIYDDQNEVCPWCKEILPKILKIKRNGKEVFVREFLFEENNASANKIFIPERIFIPFDVNLNSFSPLCISVLKEKKEMFLCLEKSDNLRFNDLDLIIQSESFNGEIQGRVLIKAENGRRLILKVKYKNYAEKIFELSV